MGSWEYEADRPRPHNHGKGIASIIRGLELVPTPRGYELVQKPDVSLRKLRGEETTVLPRRVEEWQWLDEFVPATNTYELEAAFNLDSAGGNFGLKLCVGGPQRVEIGYDVTTSTLYLDRRSSGYVTWHPGFPKIASTPLSVTDGELNLSIFVDQCAIEVFAEDGRAVMSAQIYPDPAGTGIELFSYGGATTLRSLRAWPLASIWNP